MVPTRAAAGFDPLPDPPGGWMDREQAEAIESHIPALRRYARALVRDADKADDLVQDCLERSVSRIAQFQPGTNLRTWLFTIMHNLHCDALRRTQRRGPPLPSTEERRVGKECVDTFRSRG